MLVSKSFKYEEVLGLKFGYKPIGIPKMFSHIYFVDGLLIDTGQRNARKKILSETSNLDIEKIFITHYHEDHSGNIKPLKEKFGCNIYASESCCAKMKVKPKISFAQKITWGKREIFHDIIPVKDKIETNKYSFKIIPIPGHSPDMVALYEPNKQWLFSSDLFINSYIGFFVDNESIAEQIESIKKILELDFKVMFCSHKPQLNNPKQQLKKKLDFLESFFYSVEGLYRKGVSAKQIFKQLNLKENMYVKILSGGYLSKLNMVKSVIKDIEKTE